MLECVYFGYLSIMRDKGIRRNCNRLCKRMKEILRVNIIDLKDEYSKLQKISRLLRGRSADRADDYKAATRSNN